MFRKKPSEYLRMEMFDPWKVKYPQLLIAPKRQIMLEIDAKGQFDYTKSEFKKWTMNDLKSLLLHEIDIIKQFD